MSEIMTLAKSSFNKAAALCLLIILAPLASPVSAEILIQPMIWKESNDTIHSLTAVCKKSGSRMDCTFNQVWISNRPTPPFRQEEREVLLANVCTNKAVLVPLMLPVFESLSGFESLGGKATTLQKALEDASTDTLGFLRLLQEFLDESYPAHNWPKKRRLLELTAAWADTCTPPTTDAQKERLLMLWTDLERGKCQVTQYTYERSFEQVNERTWVSNVGPSGVCGIVDVVTLEEPDDTMGGLGIGWTYKSRSFATQIEGGYCKDRRDRISEFSYSSAPLIPWPCEAIEFR